MTIHREGTVSIAIAAVIVAVLSLANFSYLYPISSVIAWIIFIVLVGLFLFIVSFFRIPNRNFTINENAIVAPADGKVVVIEEVQPDEFYSEKRIQLSVFMSPANVHVNRVPIAGNITYNQYHPGKYLVARHPKSSTENERHSVVVRSNGKEILVKQIAGALAKRIVNYLQPGQQVKQTDEMGFIKFGSRVDLLLPLEAKVQVKMGDKPKGGVTVIATF